MATIPPVAEYRIRLIDQLQIVLFGVMLYNWKLKQHSQPVPEDIRKRFHLSPLVARILANRGIVSPEDIKKFLSPSLEYLYSPFLMKDMEKAVSRISKAIDNSEKILIFGDYDVDGVTATALLYRFFKSIGSRVDFYVPDREREGYGLSREGVEKAREAGIDLVITCDCGINAFEEIELAKSFGMDVIVTDHHEPGDVLPSAYAVLDPKRKDDSYPFKELCGAGVAFKLLRALCSYRNMPCDLVDRHLDLVAIGIAADLVTVLDENRVLLSEGLKILNNTAKPGLKALIKVSGLANTSVEVVNIVFGLAPRLNAAGRIGDASRAVNLLITDDPDEASRIARILEEENRRRQSIERKTIDDAIRQLGATHDLERDKIIVLGSENWHPGVIGIVASKIKEEYNRPVVLVSFQNEVGKGSARSIEGFDIYQAFLKCSGLLEEFGGHKMAAGLVIKREKFPFLVDRLKKIADLEIQSEVLVPFIEFDSEISFTEINQELMEFLRRMAPYGPGNMRPLFVARKLSISGLPRVINENHLKFKASQDRIVISAVGWRMVEQFESLISGKLLDMAFVIEENSYNGLREVQLNVKDIKYSGIDKI